MRTNDTRPQPFSRSWRIRAFVREWRDALIWTPVALAIALLEAWMGWRNADYELLQKATAKVIFVRHGIGDSSRDLPLVGLNLDGVTVLARTRVHVHPGDRVNVTYHAVTRAYQSHVNACSYEVEQVEPATGG